MNSLFLFACLLSAALAAPVDLSTYPLSAVLRDRDGEVYTLHWGFDLEAETIRFAVNVSTTGWVGFGLSPTGGMPNSDVVIGWVNDDGEAFLQDRYATTTSRPPVDPEQNWFLDGGMEMDGFTILAFRRDLVTCDQLDREIKFETARVIYSWNEADPVNDDPNAPENHGQEQRGTTSLNLIGQTQNPPPDPADLQTFSTVVNNITVPGVTTTYWCAVFEMPAAIQEQKHYLTKIAPVITPGNEAYVHHILVYECTSLNDTHIGESGVCAGQVSDSVAECRGGTLIAGWAVGGTENIYPEGVAYPVGGNQPRYIVMETHYDNPEMRADVFDSSGMQYSYTAIAPRFEAGVLSVGYTVSTQMVIPPNAARYSLFGDCNSQCTDRYFPEDGIIVFANFLHTHLAGVGVTLRHYRASTQCDATEELAPIEQNLQYDFNYQQTSLLPTPIRVMPGDILRVECNYNTVGRDGVILGGPATQDEMCLSFLGYYPRTNLTGCITLSNPLSSNYLPNFRTEHLSPEIQQELLQATLQRSRSGVANAWNRVDWTPEAIASFENDSATGGVIDVCVPNYFMSLADLQQIPQDLTIQADCTYQAPDQCGEAEPTVDCCTRLGSGAGGVVVSSGVTLLTLCLAVLCALL